VKLVERFEKDEDRARHDFRARRAARSPWAKVAQARGADVARRQLEVAIDRGERRRRAIQTAKTSPCTAWTSTTPAIVPLRPIV